MYESLNGMPVQVPAGREKDYLQWGYLRDNPNTPPIVTVEAPSGKTGVNLILINSASLKDLSEKLGLTTQQSRELRDGRPYTSVEDLIAKFPTVTWTAFENISYEV
jgi:hypothetical protein